MKKSILSFGALCAPLASAAFAQEPPITVRQTITGNVVRVAAVETTPQRIANLQVPAGFTITKWAELQNPRMIVSNPKNGDIYISQRMPGTMSLLKDTNGDGRADVQRVVATRKWLHGMAIKGDTMYFTTIRELYRAPIKKDGTLGKITVITNDLPDAGQHPNRTMNFGPDGRLYYSAGSTTNAADEPNEENATMLVFDKNGRNRKVFASGLRNTIGFGWHPTTKRFWGWDQGIDWLGDDHQKEEINEILPGKRYGWPFVYEDDKFIDHPLPPAPYTREDWAKMSQRPALLHTAHSAGMQMAFYTGNQFPAEYKNDAFIPLRGSWNRNPPSGYQIARIRFNQAGQPTKVEPFISGFLIKNASPKAQWGHFARVAGLAQMKDGSMLFSDDTNNIVYRVAYGAKNTPRPKVAALDAREIAFNLVKAPNTIRVVSDTFQPSGPIPVSSTAYDKNISPDLRWAGLPKGTKSVAIIMDDPKARSPKPANHWLVANLPADATGLEANIQPHSDLGGGMQGGNFNGDLAYFGPKPPADNIDHHYHFQVFALDKKLNLVPGYNRLALLDAMAGHVLAKGQLVGTYRRNPF